MGWFDEQGIPGGNIAPIESGYAPRDPSTVRYGNTEPRSTDVPEWMMPDVPYRVDEAFNIPTPEEQEKKRRDMEQWMIANGYPLPDPNAPSGPVRIQEPTDRGMHNPGWGIERPTLPMPDQGGSYPLPTQDFRRGGTGSPPPGPAYMPPLQGGTLGAVGMGQSEPQSFGQRIMAGNGGRNALSGAFGGMFGGAGTPTSALGFGQAPTAALQSVSGYGGGKSLGGFAGGGGSMLRSPTGVSRQVARSDVPFYLQRGATEVR